MSSSPPPLLLLFLLASLAALCCAFSFPQSPSHINHAFVAAPRRAAPSARIRRTAAPWSTSFGSASASAVTNSRRPAGGPAITIGRSGSPSSLCASSSSSNDNSSGSDAVDPKKMGLNELQTLFRSAVASEDFDAAILYRDELADRVSSGAYNSSEKDKRKMKRLSWAGLGTAPWLVDRLDALNYRLPTTIQINAFEAVNAMLVDSTSFEGAEEDDEDEEDATLEERLALLAPTDPALRAGMGIVISGSTGSGKTLAYLVPLLSTLSQTLFTRQRIRIKAEEDVGDVAGDLMDRVLVQTSPTVRGQGRSQIGAEREQNAASSLTGAALSSLGKSGTDVAHPIALIVVPSRELGVQTALLLYELVGGSTKRTATERSGLANAFKYKGPKGVKIGCILDPEEAQQGLKLQTDVAITTPEFIGKLLRDGDVDPSKLRVVVFDEADLALEETPEEDLKMLFGEGQDKSRQFSRLTYLVGASVTESLGTLAVKDNVLPEGKSFIATATRFAPLASSDADLSVDDDDLNAVPSTLPASSKATLKDLGLCLDPGLRHERVVAPNKAGLLCLARMLREELSDYEKAVSAASAALPVDDSDSKKAQLRELREDLREFEDPDAVIPSTSSTESLNDAIQRPRVVVFFPDEEQAKEAISPMRDAMWGDHKLCVLLPNTGVKPLTIMEQFKNGETTVMLATPNSIRGLDFPALTHVYTLYLPADDPREYLHLAGRVGRIGQAGSVSGRGGRVTSILRPEESDKMEDLAKFLNFDFVDVEYAESALDNENSNVEDMRRYLEDTMTLLDLADDSNSDGPPTNVDQ